MALSISTDLTDSSGRELLEYGTPDFPAAFFYDDFRIVSHICIVDVKTCRKYHLNFKEYFDDQVKAANAIILSHVDVCTPEQLKKAGSRIRGSPT